ncbi:MAG: helix-turn-helix domain-containing protein [Proteobacteria bacterium]|nr:helix-turn-helix domain-containing protein [Pseudomonadota bacterium]
MPLLHPEASQRRYRGDYAAHAHEHAQLLFGLQGALELEIDGRAARVEPGVALIVPAGAAHGYQARRDALALVVDAPPQRALERVRLLALDARLTPDLGALLQGLAAAPRVLPRRALDLPLLAAAVEAALHEAWPTARLAALAAMSVPRLHARLLQHTGLTPQAWLRRRRLDRAQALLAAGLTLDAAALQVGYAGASALAFALRRERGVGARALRR